MFQLRWGKCYGLDLMPSSSRREKEFEIVFECPGPHLVLPKVITRFELVRPKVSDFGWFSEANVTNRWTCDRLMTLFHY